MNKKTIIGFVLGSLTVLGIMGAVANAAPVTQISGGGSGTSTIPGNGQILMGSGGNYVFIASSSLGGGGSARTVVGANGVTSTVSGSTTTVSLAISGGSTQQCGAGQGVNLLATNGLIGCTPFATSTIATTTPFANNGVVYNNNGLLSATSSFNVSSTGYVGVQNLESVQYADQFLTASTTDLGAAIDAAYAACPSKGCQIDIPGGLWKVSTPISFSTNGKLVLLECPVGGGFFDTAGATLEWTNTTGTMITSNTNNFVTAGSGIENCGLYGPAGAGVTPTSSVSSTIAVTIGGSNSAFGFHLDNSHISGFGTGLSVGNGVSFLNITNSVISNNIVDINQVNVAGSNGENERISNSVISDCAQSTSTFASTASDCINIQNTDSGNNEWNINNTSLDDAQVFIQGSLGSDNVSTQVNFTNDRFEDPSAAAGCYDFILGTSGELGITSVTSNGNTYQTDSTAICNEFVSNGGTFVSQGDTLTQSNGSDLARKLFVNNLNASTTFSWNGLSNSFVTPATSTVNNIYGTTPYSLEGIGVGTSNPVFYVTTSSIIIGSSTSNGLFSVVNASNTVAFSVASTTNNNLALLLGGHVGFSTSSVSVSACGTGSPTVLGSDDAFALVTGASASSCTLNFAKNWVNPPVCVVSDSNTTAVVDVSSISSSSVVFSLASALSAVNIYGICMGNPQ